MLSARSRPTSMVIPPLNRSASIDSGISGISGIHSYVEEQPRVSKAAPPQPSEFKPSTRLYLAFLTLAVITLAVALDGTSLSVALPVSSSWTILEGLTYLKKPAYKRDTDYLTEASRNSYRGILVWNVLPAMLDDLSTQFCVLLSHLRTQTPDPCSSNVLSCWSHHRRCGPRLRYPPRRALLPRNWRRRPHRPD